MKKKIIAIILCVCIVTALSIAFTACNKDNFQSFFVSYDLNGGKWNEEYKTEKGFESNNIITIINIKYMEGAMRALQPAEAIDAPSGKIFAGWYIDKECTLPWLEHNFTQWLEENPEKGSIGVHAKYINEGTMDYILNFNDTNSEVPATFKDPTESRNKVINITGRDANTVISQLPTDVDINIPRHKIFNGWAIDNQNIITVESLQEKIDSLNAKNGVLILNASIQEREHCILYFRLEKLDEESGYYTNLDTVYFSEASWGFVTYMNQKFYDDSTQEDIVELKQKAMNEIKVVEGKTQPTISDWKILLTTYDVDNHPNYGIKDFTAENINEINWQETTIDIIPIIAE